MDDSPSLMVFTDLDGTLLDHDTYRWDAASEALTLLRDMRCAVILASSKTAAEIAELRDAVGFSEWPSIIENGAGILPAGKTAPAENSAYLEIRTALETIPADLRARFRGFGDLSDADVAALTGLSTDAATRAKQRAFSEPGSWTGTDAEKARFLELLKSKGIFAQQGGRFLTLSQGGNKADRVHQLIAQYQPNHTIALGDAPNDRAMLEATDYGIVIANPHGQRLGPLKGEDKGRIIRTTDAGPKGWNTAMLTLLQDLGFTPPEV